VPGDVVTKQTTDNGDGTQTTKQTTYHPDGSVDTKVTQGPKPAGSATAASGAGDGMSTFCKDNPTSSICKNSTFGGSCSASFSCDGDAVQCAIAKEQHQRNCAFYDPASQTGPMADDAARLGTARADGDVPDWSPASPSKTNSTTLDFASGIKQDHPWQGGCVSDQTIALGGGGPGLVIPWSQWCDEMQLIGKLLVSVMFIVCAGIVFKQ
jgi:hypothetical protein